MKKNFQTIVQEYVDKDSAILKKYKIRKTNGIGFPESKGIPLIGRIALKLLSWSGGVVLTRFDEE